MTQVVENLFQSQKMIVMLITLGIAPITYRRVMGGWTQSQLT